MTRLNEELVNHRQEMELYLETVSGTGIVLIDSALKILDCNKGFTGMFKLQQKPIGSPVTDLLILCDNDLKKDRRTSTLLQPSFGGERHRLLPRP